MSTLLSEIEAFMSAHDLSEWQFGERAMGDRRFVKELRKGRRCWPETAQRARTFIATYRADREVQC